MVLNGVLTVTAAAEGDVAYVPRKELFGGEYWSGFRTMDENQLFGLLTRTLLFARRGEELETDPDRKQIIPYFVVRRGDEYFSAVRSQEGGDKRLHKKRLLGFGGHLKAKDIKGKMSAWLEREFEEELVLSGRVLGISFLGIVNHDGDDDDGVHQVHMGLVFEVSVEGDIAVNPQDNLVEGEFLRLDNLKGKRDEMELWSSIVLSHLLNQTSVDGIK
ncbi:MAG: phosphoesterase [Microgenomates group bacterium Gr01-1014_16]|nr:MAG: phosphoesterase [Microgenomates group bacterium Gr01-1014_16]